MISKKISQFVDLVENRGLIGSDYFDITLNIGFGVYDYAKVSFDKLVDELIIGNNHKLMNTDVNDINIHNDVVVTGQLQNGDGLVWNGSKFTNKRVVDSMGSVIDYQKPIYATNTLSITYDVNNTSRIYTYKLSDFLTDDDIDFNTIRGVMISSKTTETDTETNIQVTYPDGEYITVGTTDVNSDFIGDSCSNNSTTFIPIINEQESFNIKLNIGDNGSVTFNIDYLMVTIPKIILPEVDFVHFKLDVDTMGGYIDSTSTVTTGTSAWISSDPINTYTVNLSSIMPIEIDDDTTKTIITYNCLNGSDVVHDEDHSYGDITIDWVKNEVYGIIHGNHGSGLSNQTYGVLKGTLNDIEFIDFSDDSSTGDNNIEMEITNRTITKLPKTKSTGDIQYLITNYKTIYTGINDKILIDNGFDVPVIPEPGTVKRFMECSNGFGDYDLSTHGFAYIDNNDRVFVFGDHCYDNIIVDFDDRHYSVDTPGFEYYHPSFETDKPLKVYICDGQVYVITISGNLYRQYHHIGPDIERESRTNPIIFEHVDDIVNVKKVIVGTPYTIYTNHLTYFIDDGGDFYTYKLRFGQLEKRGDDANAHLTGFDKPIIDLCPLNEQSIQSEYNYYNRPHVIALMNDNTVQMMSGKIDDYSTDVETRDLNLSNIKEIKTTIGTEPGATFSGAGGANYNNSCYALSNGGDLYGWHSNLHGQLGVDTGVGQYDDWDAHHIIDPVTISENVEKFWAFSNAVLFVLINVGGVKTLKACGSNTAGVLGVNIENFDDVSTLTTVVGIDPDKLITIVNGCSTFADAGAVTYAICTDGLYSTGNNRYGALGHGTIGTYVYKFEPVISSLGKSIQIQYIDGNPQIYINSFALVGSRAQSPSHVYINTVNEGMWGCGYNTDNDVVGSCFQRVDDGEWRCGNNINEEPPPFYFNQTNAFGASITEHLSEFTRLPVFTTM